MTDHPPTRGATTTVRRMAPQDSLWLQLDSPANLLQITGVLWTEEPIDPDRLREVVQDRLLARYPVFRRRAVLAGGDGGVLRTGYWTDDPDFDLDRHLTVAPAPRTPEAALQAHVAERRAAPLDRARPLWSIELLQGYRGGSAVVQRYHHAMADGVRLGQVMLEILDPLDPAGGRLPGARVGAAGPVHAGRPVSARAAAVVRGAGAGPALDALAAVTGLVPGPLRPQRVLDAVGGTGAALLNTAEGLATILLRGNPHSALTGTPGVAKTAVWGDPVPLDLLAGIGRAAGATVNDVCLALLTGAVARYLRARSGPPVPDLAWMVPVNLEPAGTGPTGPTEPSSELGNHFALVLAVLPHSVDDLGARLREVHRRVARIRDSYEAHLTALTQSGIAAAPRPLGDLAAGFLAGRAVGVLTNVPGPRDRMVLAGAPVAGVVGWAPCSGPQTVTACIVSYAGEITVGLGTDRAVVPDPERILEAFDAEAAAARDATAARSPSWSG